MLRRLATPVAIFAAFLGLAFTPAGRGLENWVFDALSVATAPDKSSLPITLVGIDQASFDEIGKQFPWPRSMHAQIVRELKASGALVVAFDILMSDPSDAAEDEALAQAIREAGGIVMAADRSFRDTGLANLWERVDPLPLFRQAGAAPGLAAVNPDTGDQVVRLVPEGEDVFWRQIVRRANVAAPGLIKEPPEKPGALIRYVGKDHTYPFVPYYQVLQAAKYLPPDAFRDQIVIVGLDARASVNAQTKIPDHFSTPFTASTGGQMPGAEVHANILESAITNRVLVPVPFAVQVLLLAGVAALASFLLQAWRPVVSLLVALGLIAVLGALCAWLFTRSIWLPVAGAAGAVAATYLVHGAIGFVAERRRKAEIRRAFQLYVAPEVVDHMLAHPGRLTFGGEQRTITVLFTDLAGFTTLSEKHGRDVVARVLQQHFTRATAIVKRKRGTVIQFIGDALMAIWGAPLDDPDHAKHACEAAREMQADMELLRKELAAQGLPEIRMRIGIHTCECYVGNFGAADHFYYTALGDGVNLASRLEGANKAFGTGILVSGATTAALGADSALRPVSRIIVKGKSEPVDVYTFEEDVEVRLMTEKAIEAFGRRDWDAAAAAFEALGVRRVGDGIAKHYLAWIASLRESPPGETWDRSEALEKL